MAKTVKFGMIWQVSGTQTLEIPDCIDPQNTEKVTEFLQEHWDEIPVPAESEYISGSDTLDETVRFQIDKAEMRTLYFTVERTERVGFEKKVTPEEYKELILDGEMPFDVYKEAGFTGDDGADYDYAVVDDEGRTLVDWD